jgi:copper transport protein
MEAISSASRCLPQRDARSRVRRWPVASARSALLAATLVLLVPTLALAHLALSSSTPREGAHLTTAPRELRLTFTEAVEASVARLRLLGPNEKAVPLSPLRQPADSAQVVIADIMGPVEAGAHRIEWQVVGRDGHPVRGTIMFVIAPGATGLGPSRIDPARHGTPGAAVIAPGADSLPAAHHDAASMPSGEGFGVESWAYAAVRWLLYTALLVVIGVVAFSAMVLGLFGRTESDTGMVSTMRARSATVGFSASVALLAVALLRLVAQSVAMHGAGDAFNATFVSTMLANTVWGWGWILQIVATVVAIGAFRAARLGRSVGWLIAAVASAALALTPALSGHAAAAPRLTGLAITLDALHVIGAAGWLGSLLLVLVAGIPVAMRLEQRERGAVVARLVNAFSPTALIFAGVVVVTGLFAGWLHIGFSAALWESAYGRTLLIKLGILSVVIATGAYNWLRVRPALGDDLGARRIRRSATVEVGVAVLVLIATAVLVATPPPTEMSVNATRPAAASPAP